MSGYGANSKDIKDVSYLGIGIHDATLSKVSIDPFTDKSEKVWDVIDFTFKGSQGEFTIRSFNPDDDTDDEKKGKNQVYISNLIAYILKKIKNAEVEVPSTLSSFTELKNWAIAQLGTNYMNIPLVIKLVGNVYNGKANVQVTKYFGWLERKDSGKLPIFSKGEEAKNLEYNNFGSNKAAATSEAESTDEVVF